MEARRGEETIVIGVEGKADESFDDPLWQWRQKRLAKSPDSEAPKRLDGLTRLFFATTIDRDRDHPSLGCLGYQFLSGLAGTLADAKRLGAGRGVLLVHEFVTERTDDDKHIRNARVLGDFIERFGVGLEETDLGDSWITAPVSVRGDGTYMPAGLPVSFAKLVTRMR